MCPEALAGCGLRPQPHPVGRAVGQTRDLLRGRRAAAVLLHPAFRGRGRGAGQHRRTVGHSGGLRRRVMHVVARHRPRWRRPRQVQLPVSRCCLQVGGGGWRIRRQARDRHRVGRAGSVPRRHTHLDDVRTIVQRNRSARVAARQRLRGAVLLSHRHRVAPQQVHTPLYLHVRHPVRHRRRVVRHTTRKPRTQRQRIVGPLHALRLGERQAAQQQTRRRSLPMRPGALTGGIDRPHPHTVALQVPQTPDGVRSPRNQGIRPPARGQVATGPGIRSDLSRAGHLHEILTHTLRRRRPRQLQRPVPRCYTQTRRGSGDLERRALDTQETSEAAAGGAGAPGPGRRGRVRNEIMRVCDAPARRGAGILVGRCCR